MFVSRSLLLTCGLAVALALAAPRLSSGAAADEPYVVRAGDTLWALAEERYGGDPREGIWRIKERNDLAGGALLPGTVLYLPARAGDADG